MFDCLKVFGSIKDGGGVLLSVVDALLLWKCSLVLGVLGRIGKCLSGWGPP